MERWNSFTGLGTNILSSNFIKFPNSFLVLNVKAIAKLSSYGKKEL